MLKCDENPQLEETRGLGGDGGCRHNKYTYAAFRQWLLSENHRIPPARRDCDIHLWTVCSSAPPKKSWLKKNSASMRSGDKSENPAMGTTKSLLTYSDHKSFWRIQITVSSHSICHIIHVKFTPPSGLYNSLHWVWLNSFYLLFLNILPFKGWVVIHLVRLVSLNLVSSTCSSWPGVCLFNIMFVYVCVCAQNVFANYRNAQMINSPRLWLWRFWSIVLCLRINIWRLCLFWLL